VQPAQKVEQPGKKKGRFTHPGCNNLSQGSQRTQRDLPEEGVSFHGGDGAVGDDEKNDFSFEEPAIEATD